MSGIDAAPALPTDVASLRAMVLAHEAELMEIRGQRQAQEAELAAARAGLIEQRFEIEALKSRLAKLQRMTFGRSSEKPRDQVEQLELALADIDEMLGEITPAYASADVSDEHRCASQLAVRFLRLYRVRSCRALCLPSCGRALRPFGEHVTEILDYVPGSFRVIRHVQSSCARWGTAGCQSDRRVTVTL